MAENQPIHNLTLFGNFNGLYVDNTRTYFKLLIILFNTNLNKYSLYFPYFGSQIFRMLLGYPIHLPYNKSKFIIIYSDFKHILIQGEKNTQGKNLRKYQNQ